MRVSATTLQFPFREMAAIFLFTHICKYDNTKELIVQAERGSVIYTECCKQMVEKKLLNFLYIK